MPSCGVNDDLHHLSEDLPSQIFSEDIENQFDENRSDGNQFDENGTNTSDVEHISVGKDHYSNQLPATISNFTENCEIEENYNTTSSRRPRGLDLDEEVIIHPENDFTSDLPLIRSRQPMLRAFLAKILALVNEKAEWPLFQDACENFDEWNWEKYKEPCRFNTSSMKVDMTAFKLYKECGEVDFIPTWVNGDGNCMYNSVSMILIGNEELSLELRVSSTIAMIMNSPDIEYCAKMKGLNLADNFDYINELKNSATEYVFQSTYNFIAMCHAIKTSTFLLYPNAGVGLTNMNSLVNHGLIAGGSFPNKGFFVMWSGSKTNEYGFNHFVPLLMADRR